MEVVNTKVFQQRQEKELPGEINHDIMTANRPGALGSAPTLHTLMEKKKRRAGVVLRIALVLIGWVSLLSILFSHAGIPPEQKGDRIPSYAGFDEIDPAKNLFVLVGDTQKTSRWEFWRERNDKERK